MSAMLKIAVPLQWRSVTIYDGGYPWEFPAMEFEGRVIPGTWKPVSDGTLDALVWDLLGAALEMARNDPAIASAVGKQPHADLGRRLRREVRQALLAPDGINDLLYGQTDVALAGARGDYALNAAGRGLNWERRHADNAERIQRGLPLKRTTHWDGTPLASPHRSTHPMLAWCPAFDLSALAPSRSVPAIRFAQWREGSSTIDPPPAIQNLGVDLSGMPG